MRRMVFNVAASEGSFNESGREHKISDNRENF